jgi:tetratricopeptide (TPR) repeat protein
VLRHLANVPPAARLLDQGGVVALARAYAFAWWTLSALVVHPVDLCFFHTYVPPSGALTCAVLVLLALVLGASVWRWRRAPSKPSHGAMLLGVVWCLVAMLPGALTGPTLHVFGDRYAYFPLIGAAIALAALLESLPRVGIVRWSPALLIGVAAAQTFRLESRLGELQSEDTMFRATLARDPHNFTTLTLFGNVLARRGEYAAAEEMLAHARRVAPSTGDIDTALSFVHLHQKRYAEAETDGWRAVASKPENPRAWLNLASALVNEGKAADAVETATHAIDLRPHFAEAHFVRALAEIKLASFDAAHDDLVTTIDLDPSHAQARVLLERFHPQAIAPR